MADEPIVETPAAPTAAPEPTAPTPSPDDPLKKELARVQSEPKKLTKRERLEFTKDKISKELEKLDEEEGIIPDDKDTPVTVGMLEAKEREASKNKALELAEAIEDETERELVKHQLENNITNGSPQERLKIARGYVNSLKTVQIAEEVERKRNAKPNPSAPGQPAKVEEAFEPTPQEAVFMGEPYNLSKEDVVKARQRAKPQA